MTTLYFADPTDATFNTVGLDLNSTNAIRGTGSGFWIATLDMGQIEKDISQPENARVQVTIRLRGQFSSYSTLVAAYQSLAQYLDTYSVLAWQPDGASSKLFAATYPSPIPPLFHGDEEEGKQIVTQLTDLRGYEIVVDREPYLFGALVTGTPTSISNDPASSGKRMTVTVTGNAPTRAVIKMVPEATSKVVQAMIGRRSYGDLATFRSNWFVQAESGTTYANTSPSNPGSVSGGNALKCTYASPDLLRRARWSIAPATKSGIEGTFRVFGRFLVQGGVNVTHQLRWAASAADPVAFTNDDVLIRGKTMDVSVQQWFLVDLGTVSVERGTGNTYGLSLEWWSAQRSISDPAPTSTDAYLDYLCLMPIGATPGTRGDQTVILSTQGFRDHFGGNLTTFSPDSFITPNNPTGLTAAPLVSGRSVMKQPTDAVGTPPLGGYHIASGRHNISFDILVKRNTKVTAESVVRIAVRNIDGSSDIISKTVGFPSDNQLSRRTVAELRFDRPSDVAIQAQVRGAGAKPNSAIYATIGQIKHTYTRYADNSLEFMLDGEYTSSSGRPHAFLADTTDALVEPLSQEGPFIDLYPGANELVFDWGDLPPESADELDDRGPLAKSDITRDVTVTVSYYPRWTM